MSRALVILVALAAAATAAAAPIDPHNFEVDIKGSPPMEQPQPKCTTEGTTTACDISFSAAVTGFEMNGTVRERSSGKSGSMRTTCDFDLRLQGSMRMSAESVESSMNGSGEQRCSWFMDFGGSTIAGLLVGTTHTQITNGVGTMTGRMRVDVTATTGDFAGKVGSGTFEQSEQINQPLPPRPSTPPQPPPGSAPPGGPPGELPPGCAPPPGSPPPSEPPPGCVPPAGSAPPAGIPPECVIPPGAPPPTEPPPGCVPTGGPPPGEAPPTEPPPEPLQLFALSGALKGSQMRLKLRSGKPTAVIAAPGRKLDPKRDGGLRVVTAPGATCSAYAQQGGKRVDLGRASDGKRDGLVVVTKKLLPKLGPGSWNLIATCSYRLGSRAGTATARGVTRVG
jgi:hypothetical protein